jgi:hypothetical protein
MSTESPECGRCSLYKGEVALLGAEIAGLRQAVVNLTSPAVEGTAVLRISGMHEPEAVVLERPVAQGPDHYSRIWLTYREQLSVRSVIRVDDPSAFTRYFEDLALHQAGWEGEKRLAVGEGQFTITCTYDGQLYRPEVSMEVECALDDPSFDPYWTVRLRLELDPQSLGELARQAKTVFAAAGP